MSFGDEVGCARLLCKGTKIKTLILYMLAQAVANSIATLSLVVIAFALMGRWPPQELLLGASIGGALSPFAWRAYRAVRAFPDGPSEKADSEPPQ